MEIHSLVLGCVLLATMAKGDPVEACRPAPEVPLHVDGRMLVLKGSLGEVKDRTFAIDTGLYWTVIDERVAKDLKLKPSGEAEFVTPSGTITLQTVVIPELRLGGMLIKALPAYVMDLTAFRSRTKIAVDGFVGLH